MVESCFFDIDTWVLSEVKTEIAVCPKLVVAGTLKIHVALVEESATAGTKLNPPLFEHKQFIGMFNQNPDPIKNILVLFTAIDGLTSCNIMGSKNEKI